MGMIDLADVAVVDNHCHPLSSDTAILNADSLARQFYHGMGDVRGSDVGQDSWEVSPELRHHLRHLGVIQTMVCQLAPLLECPAELEAVAHERGRRCSESYAAYADLLYQDAGIVATVLDSDLPKGDPKLDLMPGRVMRLFQMEPTINQLMRENGSFDQMLLAYQEALDGAVRRDGFVGVKAHVAEQVGFGIEPVSQGEAGAAYRAAVARHPVAHRKVYIAILTATLLQCQELGVPVHLHSGTTGGLWNGPIADADPFRLIPFIRQPAFRRTKIVLLHASYPWIQHAAAVAHSLPHVWVDIGWVTPWVSLRLVECYRDLMGMAPLSKLMVGSGGHGTPEIAWLAAKTAKIAVAEVLGDAVGLGLIAPGQAESVGRMILYDNAARLYGLN